MFLDKPSTEEPSIRKKRKSLKDYFDFRNNQINQIGLILFSAFVISTSLHYFFDHRFDEERWKSGPAYRYEMAEDIVDRNLFINYTRKDVIRQLGKPNQRDTNKTGYFIYYVGEYSKILDLELMQLEIVFVNNRVIMTQLVPRKN